MNKQETDQYGGLRPPGFFETKSYKDVRWKATQQASTLNDITVADRIRQFVADRTGPIADEAGNQLNPPPKPASYTVPQIVYTYIERKACIIAQYPWMAEPVIYMYEEVHGEEKPSPGDQEHEDG